MVQILRLILFWKKKHSLLSKLVNFNKNKKKTFKFRLHSWKKIQNSMNEDEIWIHIYVFHSNHKFICMHIKPSPSPSPPLFIVQFRKQQNRWRQPALTFSRDNPKNRLLTAYLLFAPTLLFFDVIHRRTYLSSKKKSTEYKVAVILFGCLAILIQIYTKQNYWNSIRIFFVPHKLCQLPTILRTCNQNRCIASGCIWLATKFSAFVIVNVLCAFRFVIGRCVGEELVENALQVDTKLICALAKLNWTVDHCCAFSPYWAGPGVSEEVEI